MEGKIDKYNVSLWLADEISEKVNALWNSGEFLNLVTPTTANLMRYWFGESYCEQRNINFHDGQKQAIMNIIYVHEVLKVENVWQIYEKVDRNLLQYIDNDLLSNQKYQLPKYAVKMATGTGKTWVMLALMIWQILNRREVEEGNDRYTNRFLIITPGLIVYDRLKDTFCGKVNQEKGTRQIDTNDFYVNRDLFIPEQYREYIFSFVANSVVTKEEGFGQKVTGEGMIALTNWHLFENNERELSEYEQLVKDILPIRPGTTKGNALEILDGQNFRGSEIEYLSGLEDLMVINDEAHHIHTTSRNGEVGEVDWQRTLNTLQTKVKRMIQLDFSATPYYMGRGKNAGKFYFPHIVIDYDLLTAIKQGCVKTLILDKRQELTNIEDLDFKAKRDENNKPEGLSDGQKIMIRAGLTKLRKLEKDFERFGKRPKMLIVCEDTKVSPFVEDFLRIEGLSEEDILAINSNRQQEISETEWNNLKTKLFDIDNREQPKVIISVLMLREGFDVSNICVIVPLRSTESNILLEQTIGRGLRLMWRGAEYSEVKKENLKRLITDKTEPESYLDMLFIVEHPKFREFYDELINGGGGRFQEVDITGNSVGDLINIGLKEDYYKYDFFWPIIIQEEENTLAPKDIDINQMNPFETFTLGQLRKMLATEGISFISHGVVGKTNFGQYSVKANANLFNANSYNMFLGRLLDTITNRSEKASKNKTFPNIQINQASIMSSIDNYIRHRLFKQEFDPMHNNDWKILLSKNALVISHIITQVAKQIYDIQQNDIVSSDAIVEKIYFSTVKNIRKQERFSLDLQKTIYEKTAYPSHSGGLERDFLEFLDDDAIVESFLKIDEAKHSFAKIYYINKYGLLASYHPDFLVRVKGYVCLVETKASNRVDDDNVKRKQMATLEWIEKINKLKPEDRMNREWKYILLPDTFFYQLRKGSATFMNIIEQCSHSFNLLNNSLF